MKVKMEYIFDTIQEWYDIGLISKKEYKNSLEVKRLENGYCVSWNGRAEIGESLEIALRKLNKNLLNDEDYLANKIKF